MTSAFRFSWPTAVRFSDAIGALLTAGPPLAAWSFREICVLAEPNDRNLTVRAFSLPPTIVLAIAGALAAIRRGRPGSVWPTTFLAATPCRARGRGQLSLRGMRRARLPEARG